MPIWSAEIKEVQGLFDSFKGQFPDLEKELKPLITSEDSNVVLLYSRRCLEVIVTEMCEVELKRPRKTEPLKGIIDKLNSEEKVPYHIITSMHSLNSLSTFGTHPKAFDQEQVKPVLNNLAIIIRWYLKYKETQGKGNVQKDSQKESDRTLTLVKRKTSSNTKKILIYSFAILLVVAAVLVIVKFKAFDRKLDKSIAVLPFKNLSNDPEQEYFTEGMLDEILDRLFKIGDLKVISRTSSMKFKDSNLSIKEIAKELGVSAVLEGSVRKLGNNVRITVQLIDAGSDTHLWSEIYDGDLTDPSHIFSIQSEVAQAIAGKLHAVITPQEKHLIEKIPTQNQEAYEAYLKGQFYWKKLTQNDLETALKYFELAKEKDQEFALAYAGISDVWIGLQQMGYAPPDEAGPKAMASIMKALELDSTLAQVHYSLALVRYASEWDWESGESEFKKTLTINPNYAEARAYYSHLLNMLGRPKEAMEQIELALKLDPHNPLIKSMYGVDLTFIHRFDEAISVSREALKVDPTNPVAFTALAIAFHSTRRYEEALESWKSYCCNTYKGIAHAFDQGYKKAGYVGALRFEADTLAAQSKTTFVMPSDIAVTYALSENRKLAVEWLETAYEVHDPGLPYLLLPIFDSLRADSRFQSIAKKMNLPYK
jgi:adenylate cyclase